LAEERKKDTRNRMILEDRERMSITGVIDVLSFDEESIIAETEKGMSLLYKTFLPPRPYTPLPIPARNSNTPATSSRPYPAYVKLMSQTFLKEIL